MITRACDLDIASALDLTMADAEEAKFNALRALHAKKIRQLMTSIEAKEKEVAKLKVLSKDSRRTQMIQALRGKIKDMVSSRTPSRRSSPRRLAWRWRTSTTSATGLA